MNLMRIVWLLLLNGLLLTLGCRGQIVEPEPEPEPENAVRVLFIGNSLTYTNDLPKIVAAMAEAGGQRPLVVRDLSFPNAALEDHWYRNSSRNALASERWDFVVMQQGPSSLPENQQHLRSWALQWAEEIRKAGAVPALYMVWPDASRMFAFPDVEHAYTSAAEAAEARLFPAGSAWRAAWERDASLALYGPDHFHPSNMGSYLAALVIYGGLFNAAPQGLPASLNFKGGGSITIPASSASLLQEAAAEVLADR